ncbi:MAG: phage portal protein [Opitutae bacterium]|nr:phage portal protein [Opitutae bacterium]MCD8298918.1 phage portal protein [Opitutae bacterium]
MNIFDKFFGLFRGGLYDSAKQSPARAPKKLAVEDARNELPPRDRLTMISAARDLVRNHGFARELVSAMDIYSVGDGIFPQPGSADPKWNEKAEEYFRNWSKDPEITGRFSFAKCLSMVCRALDVDGEIFAIKTGFPGSPKLQFIEAHRCGGKYDAEANIFDGIQYDVLTGVPMSYCFDTGVGALPGRLDVPANLVIHVFVAERFSDAHGVPQIQHAVNSLQDAAELIAIEKRSVKSINDLGLVIESDRVLTDAGSKDFTFGVESGGESGEAASTDPDALKRILGGGKIGKLALGEKLHALESQRPSPTFTGFLDYVLKDSALGNIPYEFVADSSKIGGAGVRLIVGRAARKFARRQQDLIEMFLNPVWKFVIGDAITAGRLEAVENWTSVEWSCPKKVTVDAGREAAQDRADVLGGFSSIEDYYAERGMSYKAEVRRVAAAVKLARDTAKEFGVPEGAIFEGLKKPVEE